MPHMDGRGLYRQLRNDENPLRHRLLFVTGDTLAPRTVDFLQRCGVPYLAKPFLVDELKEVVARTLGTAENSSSAALDDVDREPSRADDHSQRRHSKRYES
jgi:DNA-binding response OmpR family regulator